MTGVRVLSILWAVSFAGLGLLYLTVPVSPDQALFDYMAWSHLQGDVYYGGIAEQNFPGKMFLHEAGIRLFGVHFWTFRALDALLLAGATLAGAAGLRRAGFGVAPWVFLFLYPPLYVTAGYWMAGQRDIVATGILIMAAWLAMPPPAARTVAASLAVGALVAAATLIRPTYVAALVGFAVFEWLRFRGEPGAGVAARAARCAVMLAGFGAVVAAVAGYGMALGVLDDFHQQTVLFNIEAYQVPEPRSRLLGPLLTLLKTSWHWITALGLIGALLWARARGMSRGLMLVVGLIATVLLSYAAQNKGFGYHLGGLLPLLVLLVAVAIDGLNRLRREAHGPFLQTLALAGLVLAVALAGAGTAKKLWPMRGAAIGLAAGRLDPTPLGGQPAPQDLRRSVEMIRAGSTPQEFILLWGRVFTVPFLAERRSTLRFVSTPALEIMGPEFSGHDAWLAEIDRDLVARRPAFALIETAAVTDGGAGRIAAPPDAPAARQRVIAALADYRVVQRTPLYLLLEAP